MQLIRNLNWCFFFQIKYLPRELFYCTELNTITLRNNELEEIPSAIGHLTNLTHLDFSRNSISTLPENIKACRHLQFFDLSANSLYKVPEPVTTLFNLSNLQLNDTGLDYLPANFGRLINLKILELRDNNLITLPKTMGRLQSLQRLDIGENEFTELPEIVGQLAGLTELWIDNNRIRRLSPNVGNLKKLIHFDATNNMLPEIPSEIGQWVRVQEICLTGNELSTLPSEIGKLKSLVNLKVDENQLQSLPDEIGQLSNLEELMLSHNDLISLPSLGLLRKLKILTIDENLLRSVPDEITSCISLSVLSVRGNKLTKIPADIGHMANLKVLNIVNNFIHHLPVSILNLEKLGALWISDNQSEPLIPLQKEYHADGNIGLTCFMLPQTVSQQRGAIDKENKYQFGVDPEDDPQFVEGTQITQMQKKPAKMQAGIRETKRICFATPIPNGDIDIDDDGGSQNKKLLRSPTPYPKELHVLNKYAKNLQKQMQQQNSSEIDESATYVDPSTLAAITTTESTLNVTPTRLNSIEIREAKVTTNNLINRQPTNEYEMTEMTIAHDDQHIMMGMMNNEDEISPLLNGDECFGQNSAKIYSQYDRFNNYKTQSSSNNRRPDVANRLLNGIDEFDSVSMQHRAMIPSPTTQLLLFPNNNNNQQPYMSQNFVIADADRPFSSTSFNSSQPGHMGELMSFDPQLPIHHQQARSRISSSQNYENSRLNTPTPSMISSQNSISNHNIVSSRLLPPPYEIAKIFSKKTSAEYEIYDEIRSKQKQHNDQPQPSPQLANVQLLTNGFHASNLSPNHQHLVNGYHEPIEEQNLNNYNNNVFDSGRHSIASEVSTTAGNDDGKRVIQSEQSDDQNKRMSDVSRDSDRDSVNNNKQSPEKKKWVFGLHKNPKVVGGE
jgi:Leucine-rich repeat (LRR) protein